MGKYTSSAASNPLLPRSLRLSTAASFFGNATGFMPELDRIPVEQTQGLPAFSQSFSEFEQWISANDAVVHFLQSVRLLNKQECRKS